VGSAVAAGARDSGEVRFVSILVAALVLAGVAAADPSGRIGASAIAGVGLGKTRAGYERALHEHAFASPITGKRTRLSFARAELLITLDSSGHGIAVETAAPEYKTAAGAHPCGSAAVLRKEFGSHAIPVRNPATQALAGYRVGRLAFTVRLGRIGAVMLATRSVDMQDLVNAPQCGSGEEGE
jgi:hypothetical protein